MGQKGATLRLIDLAFRTIASQEVSVASLHYQLHCIESYHASQLVKETQKKLVYVTKALSDTFSNQKKNYKTPSLAV